MTKDGLLRRHGWLVGMLALGIVLRIWITATWKPAFVGYYDAAAYARAARDGVFTDLFRPAGYPIFLRIVHAFSERVAAVTALQHLLGIATALILYVAVRKLTSARWAALIAPAVLLLGIVQRRKQPREAGIDEGAEQILAAV